MTTERFWKHRQLRFGTVCSLTRRDLSHGDLSLTTAGFAEAIGYVANYIDWFDIDTSLLDEDWDGTVVELSDDAFWLVDEIVDTVCSLAGRVR